MAYTDYIRQTPEGYIRVVNSADYDSIVSYTPLPDITVFVDAIVNLPNTVEATFKSGKVETMIIKWERVNVDTSTAGTQKIYGDIGNGAAAVLQNVIVEENLTDLDILRQIRDANPTSQLPALWDDAQDPYTEWEWVTWNIEKTRVIQLDVNSKSITSLPNINKLTSLQRLYCNSNELTTLDVSGLASLQQLDCSSNQLTTLDVSGLASLQQLDCSSNQLTALNVTGLTNLQALSCSYNQLTTLDVSGLAGLQQLYCYSNQLTSLDVSVLTSLQLLYCMSNQLTTLDVSGLASLQQLYCSYNQLTTITTLTSKGLITSYDFRFNNMPILETDRIIALGFSSTYVLPQNP